MLGRSLGALIFRNIVLAGEVLESDDVVDRYRDQIFEHLLAGMIREPSQAAPHLQFVLATRYLERIADHATNIARTLFLGAWFGRAPRARAINAESLIIPKSGPERGGNFAFRTKIFLVATPPGPALPWRWPILFSANKLKTNKFLGIRFYASITAL